MSKVVDLEYDYEIDDKEALDWFNNYSMELTSQVSKDLTKEIQQSISEGLKNHEGIPELTKRVTDIFDKPIEINVPEHKDPSGNITRKAYSYTVSTKEWAGMVSRTESIRAYNHGRLTAYKQSGVVGEVEFSSSGVERTCSRCVTLDGKIYKLKDSMGVIPVHPRCRCTWIPVVDKESVVAEEKGPPEVWKQKLSKSFPTTEFNLDGMDKSYYKGFYKILNTIKTSISEECFKNLKSINCATIQDNLFGYYRPYYNLRTVEVAGQAKNITGGSGDIYLQKSMFKNKSIMTKEIKKSLKANYTPKGTTGESVFKHELFHYLEDHVESLGTAESQAYVKAVRDFYTNKNVKLIIKELGRYTLKNRHEFMAELYSVETRKNLNPLLKELINKFHEALKSE